MLEPLDNMGSFGLLMVYGCVTKANIYLKCSVSTAMRQSDQGQSTSRSWRRTTKGYVAAWDQQGVLLLLLEWCVTQGELCKARAHPKV